VNPPKPPRDVVLIVDDTPANLAYLSDALDDAGFKVLVAIDGATALERLHLVTPDIILLDAMMPGMDGFETCRAIKQLPEISDIPVIFMTALVDTPHVVRAFEEGAIDYVTKPVCQEEVLARINTHIRRARTLQKAQKSIEACGKAGLTLDTNGNVTWQTPRVRQWLDEYCGETTATRPWTRLRTWLHNVATGKDLPQENALPLTVTQSFGRLNIHYAGELTGGEHLLLLEEQRTDQSARKLTDNLGLTAREAEVLSWLAGGKTNRDIAQILGLSPRTVNKHLEHVYVKLGVETRSAAVAVAVQTMAAPVRG
jgi:DNA-binding NarL/FixJ family response regulator